MELIARGREADVFALDGQRVLRRFRNPQASAEAEAEVMEWVSRHGLRVPHVYSVSGPDMVLERVDGGNLLEAVVAGTATTGSVAATMAEFHVRLHAVPTPAGTAPGDAIRHLDLHPLNIIASESGDVLIDWSNSDVGPAAVDTALTAVILAQAALAPLSEDELAPFGLDEEEFCRLAAELAGEFRRQAEPFTAAELEVAMNLRAHDPNLSRREVDALAAVPELLAG